MYLLWPAHDDPFPSQKQIDWQPPALMADNDSEEWLVEKILREYTIKIDRDERREFLIKWTSYARSMWKPVNALNDTTALDYYKDYLKKMQHFNEEEDNIRS